MPHGELFGQFDQRTDVIAVVVGRPQVIDFRDASAPERLRDAPEITVARVAGIHQQRLAGRTDEERRLPAFRVDVVNRQRSRSHLCRQDETRYDDT